jgi:hypothetical protein
MMKFNPADWYWRIEGDSQDRLWSSARAQYVQPSDQAYKDWQSVTGHIPTLIGSEADLQYVLAEQYPAGWPVNPVVALAAKLDEKESLGIWFTPTGATDPILFPTDPTTQARYTAAFSAISANLWTDGRPLIAANGTPVPLPTLDTKALILKALSYIEACVSNYAVLHAAIAANQAVDINTGWPSNT